MKGRRFLLVLLPLSLAVAAIAAIAIAQTDDEDVYKRFGLDCPSGDGVTRIEVFGGGQASSTPEEAVEALYATVDTPTQPEKKLDDGSSAEFAFEVENSVLATVVSEKDTAGWTIESITSCNSAQEWAVPRLVEESKE